MLERLKLTASRLFSPPVVAADFIDLPRMRGPVERERVKLATTAKRWKVTVIVHDRRPNWISGGEVEQTLDLAFSRSVNRREAEQGARRALPGEKIARVVSFEPVAE